jgi:hypothetical protein
MPVVFDINHISVSHHRFFISIDQLNVWGKLSVILITPDAVVTSSESVNLNSTGHHDRILIEISFGPASNTFIWVDCHDRSDLLKLFWFSKDIRVLLKILFSYCFEIFDVLMWLAIIFWSSICVTKSPEFLMFLWIFVEIHKKAIEIIILRKIVHMRIEAFLVIFCMIQGFVIEYNWL